MESPAPQQQPHGAASSDSEGEDSHGHGDAFVALFMNGPELPPIVISPAGPVTPHGHSCPDTLPAGSLCQCPTQPRITVRRALTPRMLRRIRRRLRHLAAALAAFPEDGAHQIDSINIIF
jgi:hypothetical protein